MRELDEDVYRTAEELGSTSVAPSGGPTRGRAPRCGGASRCSMSTISISSIGLATADDIRRGRTARFASPRRSTTGPCARRRTAVLREDFRADQGLGVLLRQVQARPVPRHHLRALWRRGHALEGASRADGHIELAASVVHICTSAAPSWLAYLLMGPRPRGAPSEAAGEGIYFAAYLVTHVDEERRHADLPNLEWSSHRDRRDRASPDLEAERRLAELERELAELESAGAKESEIRARQGRREEITAVRSGRTTTSRSRGVPSTRSRAFTGARSSRTSCCGGAPRPVRRLLRGRDGAEAIARLIDRLDLDEESSSFARTSSPQMAGAVVGPTQAEGHQAPEDRLRVQTVATRPVGGSTTRGP